MEPLFVSDIHFETRIKPEASSDELYGMFCALTGFNPGENLDRDLILAGDIASRPRHRLELLRALSPQFNKILYLAGNHEHWRGALDSWEGEANSLEQTFPNVSVVRLGKAFPWLAAGSNPVHICATLWTSYGFGNPAIEQAINWRADCRAISEVTPETFYRLHMKEKEEIFFWLDYYKDQEVVLVTHHIPARCIRPYRIEPSAFDIIFSCESSEDILHHPHPPKKWIFGHTHDKWDTTYNGIQLVSNPIGYPGEIMDVRTDPIVLPPRY